MSGSARRSRIVSAALLAMALGVAGSARRGLAGDVVAIEVGRVITVSGDDIQDGTILIEDGRIRAVGRGIEVPWSARTYRFPTGVAMPGMIDCHSTVGLRVPNENLRDAPFASVLDGLDPSSPAIRNSLRDGVTVAHVIPWNATRLGGQGAVIRLAGTTVAEMVIRSPSAMKISLAGPQGESRPQTMAELRARFLELYLQMSELARSAAPERPLETKPADPAALDVLVRAIPDWKSIAWDRIPAEKIPPESTAMVDLVRGKLPAFIYCERAADALRAFELIEANGLDATLVLGPDAWKLAAILAARKDPRPVVLDSRLVVEETDPETGAEVRHETARILRDAGVRFAVQPRGDLGRQEGPRLSGEPETHLWYQAASLVRSGVPRNEALRAVTLTPAEILGLAHRMGTLEAGKDANIAVFSGDPLDARSWVDLVLVEGREAYRRDKDRDLEILRKGPEKVY